MELVNASTGNKIEEGAMLHIASGPQAGQAWRFERICERANGEHAVRVSRSHPRMGRIRKEFHPRVFGASVVIDVTWYADRARWIKFAQECVTQIVLLTLGGLIAWVIAVWGDSFLHG